MKTVVLDKPGKFRVEDRPPPRPTPGEALVRVRRIGICGTDIHAYAGRQPFFEYPRVLGHELGVEIIEINGPPPAGMTPGARAAVEPYLNNPESPASKLGRPNCCEELQVLGVHIDGGMRPLMTVPVEKLHVSDQLDFEQLALVETLGIGAHGVARAGVKAGENVLVIGAGPIGVGVIQAARAAGAVVGVMDVSPERLSFCREQLGATHLLDGAHPGAEKLVREAFGGRLPDVVLDATGNRASMERSFQWPAHGGRLVFVGLVRERLCFDDPEFHRRELTLCASRNATPDDFRNVLRMMEEGRIDVRPMITHRLSLTELPEHFETLVRSPGLLKAVAEVDEQTD